MAKKYTNYFVYAIVAVIGIIAIDHFVLKGKLGIAGRINQLIGKFKFGAGMQSSPPIEAATPPEGGFGPSLAQETEEQFAAEMEMERGHLARRY